MKKEQFNIVVSGAGVPYERVAGPFDEVREVEAWAKASPRREFATVRI